MINLKLDFLYLANLITEKRYILPGKKWRESKKNVRPRCRPGEFACISKLQWGAFYFTAKPTTVCILKNVVIHHFFSIFPIGFPDCWRYNQSKHFESWKFQRSQKGYKCCFSHCRSKGRGYSWSGKVQSGKPMPMSSGDDVLHQCSIYLCSYGH